MSVNREHGRIGTVDDGRVDPPTGLSSKSGKGHAHASVSYPCGRCSVPVHWTIHRGGAESRGCGAGPDPVGLTRSQRPTQRHDASDLGGDTLTFHLPAKATQYQVQVTPFDGDGPGANLIRNAESSFTLPPPVLGVGPYVLLPGKTHVWRIRDTDSAVPITETDLSWGSLTVPGSRSVVAAPLLGLG